ILSGDDPIAIEMIECGARGSISITGNLFPALWREIVHLAMKRDYEGAKFHYNQIKGAIEAILLDVNPQGIKCAMAMAGYCQNSLRLPLIPASARCESALKKSLVALRAC